jgi:hypothetical protein
MVIAAYSTFKVFGTGFASLLLLISNIWVISAASPTVRVLVIGGGAGGANYGGGGSRILYLEYLYNIQ